MESRICSALNDFRAQVSLGHQSIMPTSRGGFIKLIEQETFGSTF
jgi:hypothetical protein